MCYRVFDPTAGTTRGVCDCAPGFFGVDYCEPINQFTELPQFASELAGLHIDNTILDIDLQDNEIQGNNFQYPFPMNFSWRGAVVEIPVVYSAFACTPTSSNPPEAPEAPLAPSFLFIQTSQNMNINESVAVSVNNNVPVNLAYAMTAPIPILNRLLILGLANNKFAVVGRAPDVSGQYEFLVSATDSVSSESKVVANCTLVVQDCGAETCSNQARCVDRGSPYDNSFFCRCPTGFSGVRCDLYSPLTDVSPPTALGAQIGAPIAVLAALVLIALVFIRVQNSRKRRKEYHIFIR